MSLQSESICSTSLRNDLSDILKEFSSFLISNVPSVIIRKMSGKPYYCGSADSELLSMIIRCTFHSRYDDNNIFHFLPTEALFIVEKIKCKNWKEVCETMNWSLHKLHEITILINKYVSNQNKNFLTDYYMWDCLLYQKYYELINPEFADLVLLYDSSHNIYYYPSKYVPEDWYNKKIDRYELPILPY